MRKLSPYSNINFVHVLHLFQVFFLQESIRHGVWGEQYNDAIHSSRNLETAYYTACYYHRKVQYDDFRVFEWKSKDSTEYLKRVGRVQRRIWRHGNTDSSNKKITRIFWWDPSHDWQQFKQVNLVHSQGHTTVGVSHLAGIAWRHSLFLEQDEKRPIFKKGQKWQEEKSRCKAFQQTQASTPTEHALVFLRKERFLPGSDDEPTEQTLACAQLTRCTNGDENQTPYVHHGGTRDAMIIVVGKGHGDMNSDPGRVCLHFT